MSSAGLLNGLVLNGTIRYTFAGCVAVSAQAEAHGYEPTRIVTMSGVAEVRADITPSDYTKLAYVQGTASAVSDPGARDAWKTTYLTDSVIGATAQVSGVAVRMPLMAATSEATASVDAVATRYASATNQPINEDRTVNGYAIGGSWYHGTAASVTVTGFNEILSTRLVAPGSPVLAAEAVLAELAYDLTRWMTPKKMIGRALMFSNAGDITKSRVNQKYNTGTAIARASSRGLHSAILASSIDYAGASASLDPARVIITRDAALNRVQAEALGSGVTQQDHSIRSVSTATASAHCSPDVYYGGLTNPRTAFAWGKTQASAALSKATAVRQPFVVGVLQPAWAENRVLPRTEHDVTGRSDAQASSVSYSDRAFVTHTVWMRGTVNATASASQPTGVRTRLMFGQTEGIAQSYGEPWHWVAVSATSRAAGRSEVTDTATRLATVQGTAQGVGTAYDTAYKYAAMTGTAWVEGTTDSGAVIWRSAEVYARSVAQATITEVYPRKDTWAFVTPADAYATSTSSYRNAAVHMGTQPLQVTATVSLPWAEEAGVMGARHLRWIVSTPQLAMASSGLGRNVFKINAGRPAPDRRTVTVTGSSRTYVIPGTDRQVTI